MSHVGAEELDSANGQEMEIQLARAAVALVGRRPMRDAQEQMRRAMLEEALRRTAGNATHAAALLGLTRQATRQLACRYELSSAGTHDSERARRGFPKATASNKGREPWEPRVGDNADSSEGALKSVTFTTVVDRPVRWSEFVCGTRCPRRAASPRPGIAGGTAAGTGSANPGRTL